MAEVRELSKSGKVWKYTTIITRNFFMIVVSCLIISLFGIYLSISFKFDGNFMPLFEICFDGTIVLSAAVICLLAFWDNYWPSYNPQWHKYLVDYPSQGIEVEKKVFGIILAIGLILLVISIGMYNSSIKEQKPKELGDLVLENPIKILAPSSAVDKLPIPKEKKENLKKYLENSKNRLVISLSAICVAFISLVLLKVFEACKYFKLEMEIIKEINKIGVN